MQYSSLTSHSQRIDMPNPVNHKTGDQWDVCGRCGRMFPIGQLIMQKGLRICTRRRTCYDNLERERREIFIAQILGADNTEGADLRGEITFFQEEDELRY